MNVKRLIAIAALLAALVTGLGASASNVQEQRFSGHALPERYVRHDTRYLVFYFDPQHKLAVEPLLKIADATWKKITDELGVQLDKGPAVIVARGPEEYKELQPSRSVPKWSAGVTYSQLNLVILRIAGLGGNPAQQLRETFIHELSHAALYQSVKHEHLPRWFVEGVAMYQSREWNLNRLEVLIGAAATRGLIPLKNIDKSWPSGTYAARLAYAEAIDFVAFLNSEAGPEGIKALVGAMRKGGSFDKSFVSVYGRDLSELEAEFFDTLRFWYAIVPFVTGSSFLWLLIGILAVLAWGRHKRRTQRRLAAMERAERAYIPDIEQLRRQPERDRPKLRVISGGNGADGEEDEIEQ